MERETYEFEGTQHTMPEDLADLKSAVRRSMGDEPLPAGLADRVRVRLAEAEPPAEGASAPKPPRVLRGPWAVLPFAAAAVLLLGVALTVFVLGRGGTSSIVDAKLAGDLVSVHKRCMVHVDDNAHHPQPYDPAAPMGDQVHAVAEFVHVKDVIYVENLGRFCITNCAGCKIDDGRSVHMLYACPADHRPEHRVVSVFAVPGNRRVTDATDDIEVAEMDVYRIAGFRYGDSSYFVVGRGDSADVKQLAEQLRAPTARRPIAPILALTGQ